MRSELRKKSESSWRWKKLLGNVGFELWCSARTSFCFWCTAGCVLIVKAGFGLRNFFLDRKAAEEEEERRRKEEEEAARLLAEEEAARKAALGELDEEDENAVEETEEGW